MHGVFRNARKSLRHPHVAPPPRGVSSLDLDRRRKPRGPFFCRRIWTADAWSGRTQAHQPSVPDADPFTPYGQEGRHDYRTEKETDQSEWLDAAENTDQHQQEVQLVTAPYQR